jgi:hypothetical protein
VVVHVWVKVNLMILNGNGGFGVNMSDCGGGDGRAVEGGNLF